MKYSIFSALLLIIIFCCSCQQGQRKPRHDAADSSTFVVAAPPDLNPLRHFETIPSQVENDSLKVQIVYIYRMPAVIRGDSMDYIQRALLRITDKRNGKITEQNLAENCDSYGDERLTDLTTIFRPNGFVIGLQQSDCEGYDISFCRVNADSLHQLFGFYNFKPVTIRRKNDSTLWTMIDARDEFVGNFQSHRLEISLKDFSTHEEIPLHEEIYWPTVMLENASINYLDELGNTRSKFLAAGDSVIVDSIFRDSKKIRLILSDSEVINCTVDQLKGKIQGNAAG